MPKISVKKEHRVAMDELFSERDGLTKKTWDSLRDLRQRLVEAYDRPENEARGMSAGKFIDIAKGHLGDRLGLPPESTRTPSWFAKLSSLIASAGLSEETAHQLCAYVATWATRGLPLETLLYKATTFLGAAEADRSVKARVADASPELLVDKGLFDD